MATTHSTDPEVCSSCGSDRLAKHRYLKPAGFTCDPWVKPHDKIEEVTFIPPKLPWVSAHGGEWVHLAARQSGRYRASRTGIVFHHTLGATGNGYAICLACGRAEPETGKEGNDPIPLGMTTHSALRRQQKFRCDGTTEETSPFTIKRHQALGYDVTTDVFELQLAHLPTVGVAMPLAAAFRDALARKLGVEDAEMGIAATSTRDEAGVPRRSIFVYDKAPGGMGFAVSAVPHVFELLRNSVDILDCPNGDSCRTGCPECIMCRDLESQESRLDRIGALEFLRALIPQLGLPSNLAAFGPQTHAEIAPLADALVREMERHSDAELVLWLQGNPDDWDLDKWVGLRVAKRFAERDRDVRILVEKCALDTVDQAGRIELYGLAVSARCRLERTLATESVGGQRILACVASPSESQAWATADHDAHSANADWAITEHSILVRGEWSSAGLATTAIDPSEFLIRPEKTAVVKVMREFDGDIARFAEKFWQLVGRQAAAVGRRISSSVPLRQVSYSDRYLVSPLPVRLTGEVLAKVPGFDASTRVRLETIDYLTSRASQSPFYLQHDWQVDSHRDAVLFNVFHRDFGERFALSQKPRQQLPHGRILILTYDDGVVHLYLDQGMGYWKTAVPMKFNFAGSTESQVNELLGAVFRLQAGQFHPTLITVSEGS
jgi:DEAD/DEAH box helicase domain-containing protein